VSHAAIIEKDIAHHEKEEEEEDEDLESEDLAAANANEEIENSRGSQLDEAAD
jgi:hypothetical protein